MFNRFVAYFHLAGCLGWSIGLSVMLIISLNGEDIFTGIAGYCLVGLMLVTLISGIYVATLKGSRPYSKAKIVEAENLLLQNQIENAKLRKQLEAIEAKS